MKIRVKVTAVEYGVFEYERAVKAVDWEKDE